MDTIKSPRIYFHKLWQRTARLLLRIQLRRGSTLGYLAASALMAIALLVRLAAAPLEAGLQYLTLFPAVALAAAIGGFGPGLFAVVIGIGIATFIFIPPYYTVSLQVLQDGFWSNLIFLADGIIVCTIVEAMRRYQSRLSELRLVSRIIQTTSEGFWLCDATGKLLEANDSYCRMTGYTRQDLLTMRVHDLEANESPQEMAAHVQRIIVQGYDLFETRHRRKDGSLVDMEVSVSYAADHGGTFITFVRDISRRKQIEADLRDSEERFRQLFEKAPVGIAMARHDQKIFIANAAFCRMFGYAQEELRHLTINDLTHPEHRDQTKRLVTEILEGDLPVYSLEKKYLCKDGGTFWGQITATVIKGATTQTRYIMGIVEDITERIEQEAHRLNEIKEQKDMLVREVHHRIKNNLQGVAGLLRQYASSHPEMADVIAVLTNRIFSIAVIHGLQANALMEEVDLASLLENIMSASGCDAEYTNELMRPVLLGREDAIPVALALNELVTNASKYCSSSGHVCIGIKVNYPEVLISIANHIDDDRAATTRAGHGLQLVRSLLPRKASALRIMRTGDIFSVELKLTPPAVIFDLCFNYDKGGRTCPYILSCWSKTTG